MKEDTTAFRPTILYIDDDRFLLTLCCDLLELYGYRTLLAADGPTGIEAARAGRPDAILLDLVMPGMDGLEVCRQLRAIPDLKDTPIILLFTARQALKLDIEAVDAGATLTLRKEFGSMDLLSAIERLLCATPCAASGKTPQPPT
jgi:CheY-like chemotaxis protein